MRTVRVLLLALGTVLLFTLPLREARAQTLPTDPCLTDPTSCLPNLDPCLADPASCLPEQDDVEPCVADPASCLPEPDNVDPCVSSPSSCLPDEGEVQRCVDSPEDCLDPAERDDREDGDTAQPGAAPGGNANHPGGNDGTGTRGPGRTTGARSVTEQSRMRLTPTAEPLRVELVDEAPSALQRMGRGLTDAARAFSFPLLLAASVAAFLLMQGRVDRKDPKLAVAPLDARDDLVVFE